MGFGPRTVARVGEVTVEVVANCQGCGTGELRLIVDLGHQPPVHAMLRREQLDQPEISYPLRLVRCTACGLVQLGHIVDQRIVFPPEYPYLSGITPAMRVDFRELADEAIERLDLEPNDLVIDIGSNDGTLLDAFRDRGMRVLGVEPTDVALRANARGIPTVQAFFSQSVADMIRAKHGPARVVTATNVIGHIPDIVGVFRAISSLLSADGAFISESHYLRDLLDGLQYDTIYHEHLRYYSLRPFARIAERAGAYVYDARRIRTHGGSIRVWVSPAPRPRTDELERLLRDEMNNGLYEDATYESFRDRVLDQRRRLLTLLLELRRSGSHIAGAGAPARSATLVNYCHIDEDLVAFIREQDSSPKVGLYMPMCHIPIVGETRFLEEDPDHALVLSWHIADDVMGSIRGKGYRGRFVLPLPEPRIVA